MSDNTKKVIISILLLAIVSLLFINYKNSQKAVIIQAELTNEKIELISQLSKMEDDFNETIDKNTLLAEELIVQRNNITSFKKDLEKTKKTNQKLINFYKNKIDDIDKVNEKLMQQHDSLVQRNRQLNNENQDLYEQKETLNQEKQDLTTKNSSLSDEVTKQSTFNNTLIKQNLDLTTKIALAEVVKTSGFNVNTFREYSGKYKLSTRARRIDLIKASFTIIENPIAIEKDIVTHIAITTPDGNLLHKKGSFTTQSGKRIDYSEVNIVPYKKVAITIEMMLKITKKMKKGIYTIDFYVNTKKVATIPKVLK